MLNRIMVLDRSAYLHNLNTAIRRSSITTLLGPRQCGKTTKAVWIQFTHADPKGLVEAPVQRMDGGAAHARG
jgi:ABC-type uncharacterized transport system YnjBCD ATPase subunit